MKVWEVNGRDINLKKDTNRYDPDFNENFVEVKKMYDKLQKALDKEWRDNINFWDKSGLTTSPSVEDWRCASFGPNEGQVCMKVENHVGRCSDFFSPNDTRRLIRMEASRRRDELGEILGRPLPSTTSQKYDLRTLRKILKAEKQQ